MYDVEKFAGGILILKNCVGLISLGIISFIYVHLTAIHVLVSV